ncbi:MAG: PPOX class F420-dependent oxidoreductase [Leptolinea sp.]
MSDPNPLAKQSYISLETYRKTGEPMPTPVWFAQDETTHLIYVWTEATSGKAKRIRNNPSVKLAPSDNRGKPKGDYLQATAQTTPEGSPEYKVGVDLINKKYGLLKKIFELFSGNKGTHTIIVLQLIG